MRKKLVILTSLILLGLVTGCGGGEDGAANNVSDSVDDPFGEPQVGVYCPAVEARVTPQDCEDLTRADAEVRPGEAAFTAPEPMQRGHTFDVHLVIDRRSPKEIRIIEERLQNVPGEEIGNATNGHGPGTGTGNTTSSEEEDPQDNKAAPAEDPVPTPTQIVEPLKGRVERFSPLTGRHMRAELAGEGFEIRAKTETSQQIPLGGQASWVWAVTARKGGTQTLTLVTVVEGVIGNRRFVLARTPKVRRVMVEVSMGDRIWDIIIGAPPWIKAITAIVVAVGGLLTALYAVPLRRRRKAANEAKAATKHGGPGAGGGEGEPPNGGPDA
ncbi:MAG TPA: hypothetical protein VF535_00160 [Allosphingosinicella sp.]|jgi:hypothetical protein